MPTIATLQTSTGGTDADVTWLPTGGRQTARKPAGGFIDCPIDHLTLPWWHYQQGTLGLHTLRVWLGTLELVEKRCAVGPGTPVHYSLEELRRLLQVSRLALVTAAVQQLEALGLLAWSAQAIQWLPHATVVQTALADAGYQRLRAQSAAGRRWVPVPRRLLVWLAQAGQPGVIATALGVLGRCLYYRAGQCVAGGRVAAPWIATVFGVAERTVQRALQTLQHYGWLARLPVQSGRERPHGRTTMINLGWQRPGATEKAPPPRKAVAPPAEPALAPSQKLSPVEGETWRKVSPVVEAISASTPVNTERCENAPVALFQPFQEEGQNPEPVRGGSTGASTPARQDAADGHGTSPGPGATDQVTEAEWAAATARLVAQRMDPAFLIRPVVLAEVQRARQEDTPCPEATAPQTTVIPAASDAVPQPGTLHHSPEPCPARPRAQAPVPPACARTAEPLPPPTLRNVTRADLGDVSRLLALHQQAQARGWLRGGEAAQLDVVAAAVHARRVGQAPCRLFVALLRDQRWEVITQDDEDQARRLLRDHRDGPRRRHTEVACASQPDTTLSDDARLALVAEQVLRQARWRGELFLGVKLADPTWTRERWNQAQAVLTQWRQQQAQSRGQDNGMEALDATPWEEHETDEDV